MRSSSKRAVRNRANPFPRPSHRDPEPPHIPPYQRYASALGVPEPTEPPVSLSTRLSGSLASMELSEGPISTRTRLRKRFGFPLPPTGALAVLERHDTATTKLNKMEKMSVAAAKQRGAADAAAAAAAAAKQRDRKTKSGADRAAPDAARSSRATSHAPALQDGGWQRARIGP